MLNNNQQAFFELLRVGLWEKETRFSHFYDIDYPAIVRLAEEQSVVGLITAGLEDVADDRVPKELLRQLIGSTLHIEQQNKAMNEFVAWLIDLLRKQDIYSLLVKGQGIAQCYEKPLWRASGDVDLFLSDKNYHNTVELLTPLASSVDKENPYNHHLSMIIDSRMVELHGTLRSGLWRRIDKSIDDVQRAVFYGGKVRSWMNGQTQVFLPAVDEDVVFIFSHILQHFFKEGIGLRQICDWCRLLWTYRDSIDVRLLEQRLKSMGVMTEWKAFATLAVNYLGMPVVAMPFYSSNGKWSRKADKIMVFILETGNFGHNRNYSYYKKYPYLVFKAISFWRHIKDTFKHSLIFPKDAILVWFRRFKDGIRMIAKRQ